MSARMQQWCWNGEEEILERCDIFDIYIWVFQDWSDKCVSVGLLQLLPQISWFISNLCLATYVRDHDQNNEGFSYRLGEELKPYSETLKLITLSCIWANKSKGKMVNIFQSKHCITVTKHYV